MNEETNELLHSGTKGMHWGQRLYQNKDGSLTQLGRKRYGTKTNYEKVQSAKRGAARAKQAAVNKKKGEKAAAEAERIKKKGEKAAAEAERIKNGTKKKSSTETESKTETKSSSNSTAKTTSTTKKIDYNKLRNKKISDMTDEEVVALTNRLNLENNLKQKMPQQENLGKKYAKQFADEAVKGLSQGAGELIKKAITKKGAELLGISEDDAEDISKQLKKQADDMKNRLSYEKDKREFDNLGKEKPETESQRLKRQAEDAKNKATIAEQENRYNKAMENRNKKPKTEETSNSENESSPEPEKTTTSSESGHKTGVRGQKWETAAEVAEKASKWVNSQSGQALIGEAKKTAQDYYSDMSFKDFTRSMDRDNGVSSLGKQYLSSIIGTDSNGRYRKAEAIDLDDSEYKITDADSSSSSKGSSSILSRVTPSTSPQDNSDYWKNTGSSTKYKSSGSGDLENLGKAGKKAVDSTPDVDAYTEELLKRSKKKLDHSDIGRSDELYHFGIKGQKWGVKRYQNADGTLTSAGKKRKRLENLQKTNDKISKQFRSKHSSGYDSLKYIGNKIGQYEIDRNSRAKMHEELSTAKTGGQKALAIGKAYVKSVIKTNARTLGSYALVTAGATALTANPVLGAYMGMAAYGAVGTGTFVNRVRNVVTNR